MQYFFYFLRVQKSFFRFFLIFWFFSKKDLQLGAVSVNILAVTEKREVPRNG